MIENPYNKEIAELEADLCEARRIAGIWVEGFEAGYLGGKADAAEADNRHGEKLRYILEPLETHDRKAVERKIEWLLGEDAEGYVIAGVVARALKVLPTLEKDV